MQKLRLVFDLDETLCTKKRSNETYADVKPIQDMVDFANEMYDKGHTIIISTARNMVTQSGNVGKIIQNVGLVTLQWLKDNNIKYHEIFFQKPYGDLYIDDKACINDVNIIKEKMKYISLKQENEKLKKIIETNKKF